MSIETPQYKLIKKEGNFEIRSYDEMVVARTSVNSDYKESTLTGFRRIAGSIQFALGASSVQKNEAMVRILNAS